MSPERARQAGRSSYDRALRVRLLPHNPYFALDIDCLRGLFQLPENEIGDIDLGDFKDRPEPWNRQNSLDWRQATDLWLYLHRLVSAGQERDPGLPPLRQWFLTSAGTRLQSWDGGTLCWLNKEPLLPRYSSETFNLSVPIDYCVARLIERYRLPWRCGAGLQYFILTRRSSYLERLPQSDVWMEPVETTIGQAYRVTVHWVDEYTTKKQWDDIYQSSIRPRTKMLSELRGSQPQSKRAEVGELTKQWVLDLLRYMVLTPGAGVDRGLKALAKQRKLPSADVDRRSTHRKIARLKQLMKPVD